jgi:hypothetical protein
LPLSGRITTQKAGAAASKEFLVKYWFCAMVLAISCASSADDAAFRLVGSSASAPPSVLQFFTTGTFLKRAGEWRAVAWQATRTADSPCPPATHTREQLLALRHGEFRIADDAERNALAIALLGCVGDPDPAIRDGVVYEGLATWLRADRLLPASLGALYEGLLVRLAQPDANGFRQPFAALSLSEVARTDRIKPWLPEEKRQQLVDAAAHYLESVRDYRGYSDTGGWRHGVAHGADLALQLVLNPALDAAQLQRLVDAVGSQVAPPGPVFYIYGEPARLARPVLYAYRRDVLDQAYWDEWFDRLASPAPFRNWTETFSSNAGLARRHNTLAFLSALHLDASAGPAKPDETLTELLEQAIRTVSDG